MLAPVITEQTLSDVPIFGLDKAQIDESIENALNPDTPALTIVKHVNESTSPLPEAFRTATTLAEKLRSLRNFARRERQGSDSSEEKQVSSDDAVPWVNGSAATTIISNGLGSCREIHEGLLGTLMSTPGLPREAQCVVDHVKLTRAKERYLFDAATNRNVVSDDPWKTFVWDWIAG